MPQHQIFKWLDGRGWIVLSGRLDTQGADIGDIRSLVLARSAADGGVACISLAGGATDAEMMLEDLEELGAPAGYVVDVLSEDDDTIHNRLAEAGLIVIDSAPDAETACSALIGAPIDGIQAAFSNGAIVLVEGYSASAFGSWVSQNNGKIVSGLEWLEGALVLPVDDSVASHARLVLEAQPAAYAIGVGQGSALALGPDGEVQIWGRGQVSVALGASFTTAAKGE
jgi:hypothetical protein